MGPTIEASTVLDNARVEQGVFTLQPDYRVLLLTVEGIPPGPSDTSTEALLQAAELSCKSLLQSHPVTELPHIAAWRQAYKSFGAKPQKYRNSLESLTRRVEKGLPRINRLTDIYNAISIKYQIPLGGEDLDKYAGSPFLIRATGTEMFTTLSGGDDLVEHPDIGEVVWCDDEGVTCRRWNWRQCQRTALTDSTTRVLFILDALDPISNDALNQAADELVSLLKELSPELKVSRRLLSTNTECG